MNFQFTFYSVSSYKNDEDFSSLVTWTGESLEIDTIRRYSFSSHIKKKKKKKNIDQFE